MSEVKLTPLWREGLEDKEVTELKMEIKGSPILWKQLGKILDNLEQDALKESISKQGLEKPNWEVRQAENCGYRRAINELKTILLKNK